MAALCSECGAPLGDAPRCPACGHAVARAASSLERLPVGPAVDAAWSRAASLTAAWLVVSITLRVTEALLSPADAARQLLLGALGTGVVLGVRAALTRRRVEVLVVWSWLLLGGAVFGALGTLAWWALAHPSWRALGPALASTVAASAYAWAMRGLRRTVCGDT